jgi:hypothetical protein
VFCGFGGNDSVNLLLPGDIFLGGEGDDEVGSNVEGATFNGGDGTDFVLRNLGTISNVEEGDVELP